MAYQPIENYGIIGDLHTVALVGMNGSIDWLCYPHFDSPSVFAAILDDDKGGRFSIAPASGNVTHRQFYWPDTNVLITRFLSPDGVGQVTDYMPVGLPEGDPRRHQVVRRVQAMRGSMAFRMECRPAFNYGRDEHETVLLDAGACFHSPSLELSLGTHQRLRKEDTGVVSEFVLTEGDAASFVLGETKARRCDVLLCHDDVEEMVSSTEAYWRRWLSKCTYRGRWREVVQRSALTLKLLTFEPTGAIVAAPTCSLPEDVKGARNWDYRYTWIRDAAFTIYGLMRIGLTESAGQFMSWLEARCHELNPDGSLQVMYGIDGRHELHEETLDHFEGYKGSRPVRVGNDAYGQLTAGYLRRADGFRVPLQQVRCTDFL